MGGILVSRLTTDRMDYVSTGFDFWESQTVAWFEAWGGGMGWEGPVVEEYC